MPDMPRPVATERDNEYTITIEEAAELYAKAGHPRTLRTVQRYCASGHLDCMKAATTLGDKYYVAPQSVARHIAQIVELSEIDARTAGRDVSRQAAPATIEQNHNAAPATGGGQARPDDLPNAASATGINQNLMQRLAATEDADKPRPVATERDTNAEANFHQRENERLRDDVEFLRQQVHTKDRQIEALLERDKETNYLVQGLQQLLKPLLKAPEGSGQPKAHENDHQTM